MDMRKNTDQGFDDFCRERKRVRAKLGPQASVLGYENSALRQLEQVEAEELRDEQLTREVHDFFAAATRQAAEIVERVAHEAQEEAGERIEGEVEGFLIDTLSRMNGFIVSVMQQRRNVNIAETRVEPDVKNLVGHELDEFRWAGNSEARDAHIGQDPFATALEDVQREFRAVVAEMDGGEAAAPIEEHLVAEAYSYTAMSLDEDEGASQCDQGESEPSPEAEAPVAEQELAEDDLAEEELDEEEPSVDALLDEEQPATPEQELETFKHALKALVRQGVMQREEARAAWMARLAKLGRVPT